MAGSFFRILRKEGEKLAVKRMNIKISEDMHAWIQQEADKRGLTMNAVIIFALETYYNQQTVIPGMQALLQEVERQKLLQEGPAITERNEPK